MTGLRVHETTLGGRSAAFMSDGAPSVVCTADARSDRSIDIVVSGINPTPTSAMM